MPLICRQTTVRVKQLAYPSVGICLLAGMLKKSHRINMREEPPSLFGFRDAATWELLLEKFPHWCRDVDGLSGRQLPDNKILNQGGSHRPETSVQIDNPGWVERSHLSPIADPTGWDAMTGISTVDVLYRGVFVQEFEIKEAWGIEGSIDVDPKHFKPRLNREAFVAGQFQAEVEEFLWQCHPAILEAMAGRPR